MSNANNMENLLDLIKELRILFKSTADSLAASSPEISENLIQAVKTLKKFESQLRADKFVIAFVGLTNVGKSTLMNALLGAHLAPRSNCPWSSAPVEYVFGEELEATVIFDRSITRHIRKCCSVEELSNLIRRSASEEGDLAQRGIRKMTVCLPVKLLEGSLVIVDTPGFGAAQTGGRKGEHERILLEYLPKKANQVFWIISSEQGITSKEKDFHEKYLKDICEDVIFNIICPKGVSPVDEYNDKDRERFRNKYGSEVSITTRWHFIAALHALEAKMTANPGAIAMSGIKDLEERLWELATPDRRKDFILRDILKLCDDIGYHVLSEYSGQWPPWPETDIKAVLYATSSCASGIKEKITEALITRK